MPKAFEKLLQKKRLSQAEFLQLLNQREQYQQAAAKAAKQLRDRIYGRVVYLRALIEYSSFCLRDCYYCGLRMSNDDAIRYRLDEETILETIRQGYAMGFRTFVLQGGEDPWFSDEKLVPLVQRIKEITAEAALTISAGERSLESYQKLRAAGADRYLLRHESRNPRHYRSLHPDGVIETRIEALRQLKELGFHAGAGMMVGSPYQTLEHLAEDLFFLQEFRPQMVGIGPFLPHHDTPFKDAEAGDVELTLYLLSLIRLILPTSLLPATTALASLSEDGRIRALEGGANVLMPNLSPLEHRAHYAIYDGKKSLQLEGSEGLQELELLLKQHGYVAGYERGDAKGEYDVSS